MTRPIDEIEDDFYREVDIVRGLGGHAPTTDDLRWLGEQRAYAAMGEATGYTGVDLEEMRRLDNEENKKEVE